MSDSPADAEWDALRVKLLQVTDPAERDRILARLDDLERHAALDSLDMRSRSPMLDTDALASLQAAAQRTVDAGRGRFDRHKRGE